jgi:hypothetical protein
MNTQFWKAVQLHRCFLFLSLAVPLLIGISRSSALAQTWTLTSAPQTNWVALATSSDGTKVFAAAGTRMLAAVGEPPWPVGPIFISTNSGLTWVQSSAPVTNWTQVVCSADGTLVYATSESSVYSSTNSGTTWDALDLSPSYQGSWDSLACSADGTTILAAHNYPSPLNATNHWLAEVFVSTNQGVTWTNNLFNDDTVVAASVSADGGQMVCSVRYFDNPAYPTASIFEMVISRNGGQTWAQPLKGQPQFVGLVWSADGSLLVGAAGAQVGTSKNFATNWVFTSNVSWYPYAAVACSADCSRMVAVGLGIWLSKDTGATWSQANLPAPAPLWPYPLTNNAVVSSADGCTLYASVLGGSIYSWHVSPSPFLGIRPSALDLEFSWIVPSVTLGLEQSSNLTSGGWQPLPVVPTLNYSSLQYEAKVPKPQGTMFYRLVSP